MGLLQQTWNQVLPSASESRHAMPLPNRYQFPVPSWLEEHWPSPLWFRRQSERFSENFVDVTAHRGIVNFENENKHDQSCAL
jgi:hypothetical protein